MNSEKNYLVSVYMTTYFHENYVEQAIESILSQKVNFDYEIVISDDASGDSTPEILQDYAKKYPFIRINLNKENIGLSANVFKARMMCSGKYIVQLSGDDYWIDDNKLQKQVDFLENNYDYFGVVSRIEARSEFSKTRDFVVPEKKQCNKSFGLYNYLKGMNYPTNGLMIRNVIKEKYDFFSIMPKVSKYIDDETDCLLYLLLGNVYITSDITVAYRRRISAEGENNFNSINNSLSLFQKVVSLLNSLDIELSGKYNLINRYKRIVAQSMYKCYRPFKKTGFKEVYKSIPTKYRKQGLLLKSFFYMFYLAFDKIKRNTSL